MLCEQGVYKPVVPGTPMPTGESAADSHHRQVRMVLDRPAIACG